MIFFTFVSFVCLFLGAAGDSLLGLLGYGSCPGGYVPILGPRSPCPLENPECRIAYDLCKQEAINYGTFDERQDDSWDKGRPAGCFFNPSTKNVHFNYKWKGGLYFGDDQRVCRKNPDILAKHGQDAYKGRIKIDWDRYVDEKNITLRRGKPSQTVSSGWVNDADALIKYTADPGYIVTGFKSSYRGARSDRVYSFDSQRFPGTDKHDSITTTSFCNIVDASGQTAMTRDCRCGPGQAIVGFYSEHMRWNGRDGDKDNWGSRKDRRWKLHCSGVFNMKISPWTDDHIMTQHTNYAEKDTEASCPQGTVACGMESSMDWTRGEKVWDRGYKLLCCKAWVYDPSKCEAFEIIVDQMKVGKPPQSKNIVVDTSASSNCGSATPVQFKIERKREFTQDLEETLTFSKSMADTFNSKVASQSKMNWKVNRNWNKKKDVKNESHAKVGFSTTSGYTSSAATGGGHTSYTISGEIGTKMSSGASWGNGGSRDRGGEFMQNMAKSWTNNVKSTETSSTKTKSIKKDSFSQGYSYLMPAGSRVTLTATVDTYRGDVKWWGTAFCYGSTGALLETQPITGTYKGALIGDTRVVVDTKSCPSDNWDTHDYAYCSAGDWLKDPNDPTKFVKAKSKDAALEACMNNKDCECVMDRGCKNDSLLKRVTPAGASAKGLFDQIPGSYILCKTGCQKRLEPSLHTCTFSYKEPTCSCDNSGGGPLKNAITCSDRSTFTCDEGQTCDDTTWTSQRDKHNLQPQDYRIKLALKENEFECPTGYHTIEAPKMPCFLTNDSCLRARQRCIKAAEELKYNFVHDFSEAEALWFPSGCFLSTREQAVRFNHLGEGPLAGQGYSTLDQGKEFFLLCGKDRFTKEDASDGNGGFPFSKTSMCSTEGTCYKVNKIYKPKALAAPVYMIESVLVNKGGSGCTASAKCGVCEGDCDSDADCKTGLKCFQRASGDVKVPFCQVGGAGDIGGNDPHDYCYDPRGAKPLIDKGVDGGCTADKPCERCEGDCDTDDQCAGSLKCFQRWEAETKIPGCYPGGKGDVGGWNPHDYCYDPNPTLYTNWKLSEPNNKNHGDEDCVVFDPLLGEWKSKNCNVHIMAKLVCGANTGGEFHRFDDEIATSFEDAKRKCYNHGMALPYIRNRHDTAFMLNESEGDLVWLALNDQVKEGSFEWAGQAQALTYSNWHTCGYDPDGEWKQIKNKFSHGFISIVKYSLTDAKKLCDTTPTCKAITCETGCTLRSSEILTPSAPGKTEITYIRQACNDVEHRTYEVSISKGKCLTKFGETHPDTKLMEIMPGTENCRIKCTKDNRCQGFSVQRGGKDESDLCIHYLGDHAGNLKEGGQEWGDAHCHVKSKETLLADGRANEETCAVLTAANDIDDDLRTYQTACVPVWGKKLHLMELFGKVQCPEGKVLKYYKIKSKPCSDKGLANQSMIEYSCYTANVYSTNTQFSPCFQARNKDAESLDQTWLECKGDDEVLSGFKFQLGKPLKAEVQNLPYDLKTCARLSKVADEVCSYVNPPINFGDQASCERQCKARYDCSGYQWQPANGNCDLILTSAKCGAEKIKLTEGKGTWTYVSRFCFDTEQAGKITPPGKCQQEGHANFRVHCSKIQGALPVTHEKVEKNMRTKCDTILDMKIELLDRHSIDCPKGYVLKYSRLVRCDETKWQYHYKCTPFDPKQKWLAHKCEDPVNGKVVCGSDKFEWRFNENMRAPDHVYDPPTYYPMKEAKERCKHNLECNSITCSNRLDWGQTEELCSLRKNTHETIQPSDLGETTWDLKYTANYVSLGEHKLNQKQASDLCGEKDMPLAIATTVSALKTMQKVGVKNKMAWSNLKVLKDEGIWKWMPPPALRLKWSDWVKGGPTNKERTENCAAVYATGKLESTDNFLWNDLPCDFVLHSSVLCEWREDGKVRYELSRDTLYTNHAQARAFCHERGGTLATFLKPHELEAAKFAAKDAFEPGLKMWIGLTDEAAEGKWTWDILANTRTKRDIPTPSECKLRCFDDWKCKFWNWSKEEGTCELLESVADEVGVAKTDTVSGPEKCPRNRRRSAFERVLGVFGM